MATPITHTKVIPPRRRRDLLTRPRLLELLLDLLDYRLVLLLAPAGYGKTSLLVDLADQVALPVCWYAIEAADEDMDRFLAYFVAAIEVRFPEVGERIRAVMEESDTPSSRAERVLATLINEMHSQLQGHIIVVLDDYHLVAANPAINDFVGRLIHQAGPQLHFIVASRTPPPLPDLTLLAARNQIGGLSFAELAFRPQEIQQLVFENYGVALSDEAAQELVQQTEGWITALLLSAHALGEHLPGQFGAARGAGVSLYDYLAQQVLDQQPPEVRRFLLRTSLLEEFDAALCTTILGEDEDWQRMIDLIFQRNLFVTSVGDDDSWVRYHHLFRDFLQARLAREEPAEERRVLMRLAAYHAANHDWDRSYLLYQRLGATEQIARLLEEGGADLVRSGRTHALASWIDALPRPLWNNNPTLLSLRGTAAMMLGQMLQSVTLLGKAIDASRQSEAWPLYAHSLVRRATAHRFQGDYQASLADAEAALRVAERESLPDIHPQALRAKGIGLYHLGRFQEAVDWLKQALVAYDLIGEQQNVGYIHMEIGVIEFSKGQLDRALAHYRQALSLLEEKHNTERLANLLNNLGVLYHLRGEYTEALDALERALFYAGQCGYTRMQGYLLCGLGDVYLELNALGGAQLAYEKARGLAEQSDEPFLLFHLTLAETALKQAQGNLFQAHYILENARQQVEQSGSASERTLYGLAQGRLLVLQERPTEAARVLREVVRQLTEGEQWLAAVRAEFFLAMALYGSGASVEAHARLSQAYERAARQGLLYALAITAREVSAQLEAWAQHEAGLAQRLFEEVQTVRAAIPRWRRAARQCQLSIPFDPPSYEIRALGEATVFVQGQEAEWGWAKARDLFFCLLLHPEGLPKETLAEWLWPDNPPRKQKARFKEAIHFLRRALGAEVVLFDGTRYRFNDALDYDADLENFQTLVAKADRSRDEGEQIRLLQQAARLYQGLLLPPLTDEWLLPLRTQLQTRYLSVLLTLSSLFSKRQRWDEALAYVQQALAVDPALEEAHRQAMRVHGARGNLADVARQYERCQEALDEELAVPPSEQTRRLYESLLGLC